MNKQFEWERISEHLYRFEDTCNVYALIENDQAVLVDFGSGAVLDHLADIGINNVKAILHTHHHRGVGYHLFVSLSNRR